MANPKAVKNEIAGKAKRIVGEVLGDQKLHDEGDAQEPQSREERNDPADVKPFGNLDKLT
jgi:uncharacterized protein YjbJ (UPF0337 family)